MACEYCYGTSNHHDSRCPNYMTSKTSYYCSICGGGIYTEEKYVERSDNKHAHYDCLTDLPFYSMIKWLGGEVRTMED